MKHKMAEILLLDCRPLEDEELFQVLFQNQDGQRKEKILRCREREEQLLSLGGGCLLSYALASYGAAPDSLRFDENGAPYVEGEKLCVSLSHSGCYAAVAISDSPISVDIEQWAEPPAGVAERFFTDGEKAILKKSRFPKADFYRIWSRKECLIKLDGLRDLRELDSSHEENSRRFAEFELESYSLVSCSNNAVRPELRFVDMGEIVK